MRMKHKMVTGGSRVRAEKLHMEGSASPRVGSLATVLGAGCGRKQGVEMMLFSGLRKGKKGVAIL